jgi:hypothetical protein
MTKEENKPFVVLLTGESVSIQGNYFSEPEKTCILEGKENQIFEQYARAQIKWAQANSAWHYLDKINTNDPFFYTEKNTKIHS